MKFKDADLLGLPLRVTIGSRALKEGVVELKVRKTGEEFRVPPSEVVSKATSLLSQWKRHCEERSDEAISQ